MDSFDKVYYTLLGVISPEVQLPWVSNAFAEGSLCGNAYKDMREAYKRIVDRLQEADEDADLEIIVTAMQDMQKILCEQCFYLGMRYIEEKHYLDKAYAPNP